MANKKGQPSPEDAEEVDALDAPGMRPKEVDSAIEEATRSLSDEGAPVRTATPVFDSSQSCTTVGPTVVIRGKIRSEENLVVYGRIEAGVRSTKDVRIESTGIINSDVDVRSIWVAGIIVGDIRASSLVELAPEARVVGNIQAARLVVKDGAKFRGNVDMDGLQALEAIKPPTKKAGKAQAVAEVIWSDVEDLAPTPAHRAASVSPQPEPRAPRTTEARPAPAEVAVGQRVRQPTAPPKPVQPPQPAAERPAPSPPASGQPAQPASSGDKGGTDADKGIGSWFRRQ